MLCFKTLASIVEGTRLRIDEANQLIAIESAASASISDAFDGYRKARDTASEEFFAVLYGG